MNSDLREFFNLERKRFYQPDAFFAQRVMARLKEPVALEYVIWDMVPTATRPVLALALTVLLALLSIKAFVPVEPSRGLVDAYLSAEQSPGDSLLFTDADIPEDHDVLEHLIVLGGDEE